MPDFLKLTLTIAFLSLSACADPALEVPDAGNPDAGTPDAAPFDAGRQTNAVGLTPGLFGGTGVAEGTQHRLQGRFVGSTGQGENQNHRLKGRLQPLLP